MFPFPGGSVLDKLRAHRDETPRPVGDYRTDVPSEAIAILKRMTTKRPEDRYQSAREVAKALRQILNPEPPRPKPTPLFSNVLLEDRSGICGRIDRLVGILQR
jgi:serine/threonine protein kinase